MIFTEPPSINLLYKYTEVTARFDKKDVEGIIAKFSKLKPGVEYDIDIKESNRRSLNANNYHWQLVEKIAQANKISKTECHNLLMQDYGTDWLDEEGKQVYVLMKDTDNYLKMTSMHYRPTDATEDRKGTMYRWFVLLLPSHLMDKKQMSALIDGTVREAQELGVETRTPDEIARMKAMWGE
jgi:hypothetical protein